VVIWDNLNTHLSATMRELAARRDWLHVIQLPAYAPDLNPTEGLWPHVTQPRQPRRDRRGPPRRRGEDRLKRIQYRPDLLTSFLAQTALALDPEPL
jgi:transposase